MEIKSLRRTPVCTLLTEKPEITWNVKLDVSGNGEAPRLLVYLTSSVKVYRAPYGRFPILLPAWQPGSFTKIGHWPIS